jgi:hypothetical protein
MRLARILHISSRARTAAETECARRQRLAVPGLVGGPLAFLLAIALYLYSALGPSESAAFWGGLGNAFFLLSLGLLVWAGHFMDCTDKGEPAPWLRSWR